MAPASDTEPDAEVNSADAVDNDGKTETTLMDDNFCIRSMDNEEFLLHRFDLAPQDLNQPDTSFISVDNKRRFHFPNLGITDAESHRLAALKTYFSANHPEYSLDAVSIGSGGDFKLVRFLRAHHHDVESTAMALVEHIVFRSEWHLNELNVNHVNPKSLPYYLVKTRAGGVAIVMYATFGDAGAGTLDSLVALIHLLERTDRAIAETSQPAIFISDMMRFDIKKDLQVKFEKTSADLMTNHFPGLFSLALAVNTSPTAALMWALLRPIVPQSIGKLLVVIDGDPNPVISQLIPSDELPTEYGGSNPITPESDRRSQLAALGLPADSLDRPPMERFIMINYYGTDTTAESYSAVRKGFAHRRGNLGVWRRVYLVLMDDALYYFSGPDSTIPINGIGMGAIEVFPCGGHGVMRRNALTAATLRKDYYFAFSSIKDRDGWVDDMRAVAKQRAWGTQ